MKRNPWPYAIIAYFVVFIASMATWVVFAVRNDQQLVRKDYYEHELKYQTELDSMNRASGARAQIGFNSAAQMVSITLPENSEGAVVRFYRPSNAALDRELKLASAQRELSVSDFEPGLWRLRLRWKNGGADFQQEQTLVLASSPKVASKD
jgi:hypothetical protein